MDSCKKTQVLIDEMVSSIEVVNCHNVKIQVGSGSRRSSSSSSSRGKSRRKMSILWRKKSLSLPTTTP